MVNESLGAYPQTRGSLYKDSYMYFCDIVMIMGSHEVKSTGSHVGRWMRKRIVRGG